jgi:hypothetical protein
VGADDGIWTDNQDDDSYNETQEAEKHVAIARQKHKEDNLFGRRSHRDPQRINLGKTRISL